MIWQNDKELFSIIKRELYTAVVGDVMDRLGLLHQFLPPQIKPLHKDMVVVGRAMPVLEADVFEQVVEGSKNEMMYKPFGIMMEALDSLKHNEVYICTGASPNYALWGEIMSNRAIKCGAAGAVVNGYSRDTKGILRLNFPTFSIGSYSQDQGPRGKVIDFRIPIEIGSVKICPGDIIFGDIDGVCVIPSDTEKEVFVKAIEKARGEKTVKQAISTGVTAREVFDKYGIM